MTLEPRRSPAPSLLLALLLAIVAVIGVPTLAAGAGRPTGTAGRWIVAVARGGGSAIGPRASARTSLPRSRAGRGNPAAQRQVQRLLREGGIRPSTIFRHAFDGFAATLSPVQLAALRRDRSVAALMPDVATRVEDVQSGSVVRTHLKRPVTPTGIRRINATSGPLSRVDGVNDQVDVDVAIIDTGIAPTPELRIAGGFDCSSDDPDAWRDREGHGTHVAGTIGARDDKRGVVGVAPGARLWAIKIFDDAGSGFLSEELCGFDHVLGMRDPEDPERPRIEVINLSIGQWLTGYDDRDCGRPSGDLVHGAVCALVADGTTIVAAAGNQSVSTIGRQPAAYDELLTISALADFDGKPGGTGDQNAICPWYSRDQDDTFGDFSNYGPDVDLIAPGKCILSTMPDGWYAWSTGTSMATPHVTGAVALLAARYLGARPSQIRAALLGAATDAWATHTDPDKTHEPVLDVSRLGALPDLTIAAGDPSDELAHSGLTRIDVTIDRVGGHDAPVTVTVPGLPDGVTADVASSPTRGSAVAVWLHAGPAAPDGPLDVTIRATDGDLVRTTSATVKVRAGGPTVDFSAPDGGADHLRLTEGDGATVAFLETDPGAAPVERRVLRQSGVPVEPGSCEHVDWSAVGDAVTPESLDPSGSLEAGWSFPVELTEDGCSRWLVRLIDEDGGSARFVSPAVLRDTTDPTKPTVDVTEADTAQTGGGTIWVRGGRGSLTLTAIGHDAGSGVTEHRFSDLSDSTGWTVEPGGSDDTLTLSWTPDAVDTRLTVRAVDALGHVGPARAIDLKVDASAPRASGWFDPPSGSDRVIGWVVELGWRGITDTGSDVARLQRVQRQVGRPSGTACGKVTWADDGPARLVAPHDEQWDLASGYCYRWILTPLDRVGNVGRRAISGAVYVDLLAPKADFLTPDEGTVTVTARSRYRLAWTERRQAGGGLTFRSLEQEQVRAVGDTCPTLGWVRHGPADTGASPSRATGLRAGFCYRWRLNLADSRDNLSTELSGIVRVVARP